MGLLASLRGMRVIATCNGTNYVRLPDELQESCGPCDCAQCQGESAKWDTLAVPPDGRAWLVHMPDGSVPQFRAHAARQAKGQPAGLGKPMIR